MFVPLLAALCLVAATDEPHTHEPYEDDHDEHRHHEPCDRPRAREARHAILTRLAPLARQHDARMMSRECALHPESDHLQAHEQQKSAVNQYQWRCGLCTKLFRSEHYLDMHLERKHAAALPRNASGCLGDFCDILHCPSWASEMRHDADAHRHHVRGAAHVHGAASGSCPDAKQLDARRHFCQHLMHDCFAGEHEEGHAAFEALDEAFCQPIGCDHMQRVRDGLETVPAAHTAPLPHSTSWYYALVGIVLSALTLGYLGIYCWLAETRVGQAGRRLRPGRGRGLAALLGWKLKGS